MCAGVLTLSRSFQIAEPSGSASKYSRPHRLHLKVAFSLRVADSFAKPRLPIQVRRAPPAMTVKGYPEVNHPRCHSKKLRGQSGKSGNQHAVQEVCFSCDCKFSHGARHTACQPNSLRGRPEELIDIFRLRSDISQLRGTVRCVKTIFQPASLCIWACQGILRPSLRPFELGDQIQTPLAVLVGVTELNKACTELFVDPGDDPAKIRNYTIEGSEDKALSERYDVEIKVKILAKRLSESNRSVGSDSG